MFFFHHHKFIVKPHDCSLGVPDRLAGVRRVLFWILLFILVAWKISFETNKPLLSPGLPHGLVSPVARDLHPILSFLHNDTKKRLIIIPRKRKRSYSIHIDWFLQTRSHVCRPSGP